MFISLWLKNAFILSFKKIRLQDKEKNEKSKEFFWKVFDQYVYIFIWLH